MDQTDYDVIIIGAAISGATLMNILADEDLKVLVLDKETGVLEIPRAAHIDDEVMRYFENFGMYKALGDSYSPNGRFDFFDDKDQMIMSFPESVELDQGYLSGYYFHQPTFEHYLRDRGVGKGVTMLENHEVFDIAQDADKVTVSYRDLANPDRAITATAKYLVACDGSSSFVRKNLGISMTNLAKSSSHIIVDFRLKDGVKVPEELGYCVWARMKKDGTTIYVHMPKEIKRLEFDVPEGVDREQFESHENAYKLLSPWVKREDVKEILRSNIYTYHSLVADSWKEGRMMLVGDAAHLTPPFLGQGACAAVRDVFNLGWKLARVIKGTSPAALLDTYQSERLPHAADLVGRAGKIGEMFKALQFMSPEQIKAIPGQMQTMARPILGPGLHGDAAVPAGTLSPQPRLPDGALLDEKTEGRFAVVGDKSVIGGMAPETKDMLDKLDAVIVEDDTPSMQAALQRFGGGAMVVRPDLYLLGVAQKAEELDEIISVASQYLFDGQPSSPSTMTHAEARI